MEEKEIALPRWKLCYVKNGVCVFVDKLLFADASDWYGEPFRNASWPEPKDYYQQKLLGFATENATTDLFGKDSIFNEWCQSEVVHNRLPAFVISDDFGRHVVRYGDEAHTVMEMFRLHRIPCGWLE